MPDYKLPDTKSLDEENMTRIKGVTNLISPLMITSVVIYAAALILHHDGKTSIVQFFKKLFTTFGFG